MQSAKKAGPGRYDIYVARGPRLCGVTSAWFIGPKRQLKAAGPSIPTRLSSAGAHSGAGCARFGEPHASPSPQQVLFCLSGRVKITCSSGETAIIEAGAGLAMSDVNGRGHKTEVLSAEPVSAIIIQ